MEQFDKKTFEKMSQKDLMGVIEALYGDLAEKEEEIVALKNTFKTALSIEKDRAAVLEMRRKATDILDEALKKADDIVADAKKTAEKIGGMASSNGVKEVAEKIENEDVVLPGSDALVITQDILGKQSDEPAENDSDESGIDVAQSQESENGDGICSWLDGYMGK